MFSNKTTSTRRSLKWLSLMVLLPLLQACADSNLGDLQQFVVTAHQGKKPEIEPLPEIPPFKAFEYASGDEVDPFSTQNIVTNNNDGLGVGEGKRPDSDRRRQPLEQFPLDALSIVGTITQEGVPHVVVRTTEGTAVLASLGNYMGQNDGKITEIIPEEQRVVLIETVLDPAGRWVTRDVEITIDE